MIESIIAQSDVCPKLYTSGHVLVNESRRIKYDVSDTSFAMTFQPDLSLAD